VKYRKTIVGFVTQSFEDGRCVSQEFTAGDEVVYERDGETIEPPEGEVYQPLEMQQPASLDKHEDQL